MTELSILDEFGNLVLLTGIDPVSDSTRFKKVAMLNALRENGGNVADACKSVKISRTTHYNYLADDDEYGQVLGEIKEASIDNVASALYKNALEGDTTAQIFYLKNRRPDEWHDMLKLKQEHSGSIGVTQTNLPKMSFEQMYEFKYGDAPKGKAKFEEIALEEENEATATQKDE